MLRDSKRRAAKKSRRSSKRVGRMLVTNESTDLKPRPRVTSTEELPTIIEIASVDLLSFSDEDATAFEARYASTELD